jgi:hypothetical protein
VIYNSIATLNTGEEPMGSCRARYPLKYTHLLRNLHP